jgi:oligopeptide transport system ATP-binding protein
MRNSPDNTPFFLEAEGLKCHFPIRKGIFSRIIGYVKAVDGVSFDVTAGETFGLVGETACGKSTTARLLMGLIKAAEGTVRYRGESLFDLKGEELLRVRRQIQMVFQDPYSSLDPRMTAGTIIAEPLEVYGQGTRKDRRERVAELLNLVGLHGRHAGSYPHEFSGGQRQRIGIARALDVSIQSQVLNLLQDLQARFNLTYFFISHDLSVVRHICDRVAVMYLGRLVEIGTREEIFEEASHPYTQALLSAIPQADPKHRKKCLQLKGEVPSPIDPPAGCHFHPRCPCSMPLCREQQPSLRRLGGTHQVACCRSL